MNRPVLLLEAAGPESGHLARTAAASGHPVHTVTTTRALTGYSPALRGLLAGTLTTDLGNPQQALADTVAYARRINAAAVLTTNEYLTALAAHACALLDLPGNDPVRAYAARDKAAMAEAFTIAGVTAPRTHTIATPAMLRTRFLRPGMRLPLIVKPADAAGSQGVTVLARLHDADTAWQTAHTAPGMYAAKAGRTVLLQQYIPGREYSVESFTQHGRTTHLAITTKTTTRGPHRVELAHTLPTQLPPALEQAIHREVTRAVHAVGICNSASHTEVIVTPTGRPYVIETAARIGAGHIGDLLHHALGINPWTALLDIALGRPARLTPARRHHATAQFLTSPAAGRLTAVTGLPRPGPDTPLVRLRARPGDTVGPAHTNAGRLGSFIVVSPDARTTQARVAQLLHDIDVHVEPQPA
ncbi:ATP-grasp domain-containing protein [Streptomyces erythrochromogenes]|uniref:ATP-grasp domain-containing protein n=1 Tax=Streptomyces erythrochromogenes TaxID=285574 RepID=UPI0036D12D76